jgi:putative tributyrin esterase
MKDPLGTLPGESRSLHPPHPLKTGTYFSAALGQDLPYAFLEPEQTSAESEQRNPLLVMLHGLDGSYRDWPSYTRIARYAAKFNLVIAFPEGENGWYTNTAEGSRRYEDSLIQDFLPHLQRRLALRSPGKAWAIGGLSMGGYGAVKIALKYPHLFSLAISHSGSLEKPRTPEVHPVFGDPQTHAAIRLREDPVWLIEQALCRLPTERPRLHLDCGLNDPLLGVNRRFADHLTFLGYPHTYREQPGFHTWPYWDRAFRTIFPTVAHALGAVPEHAL